MPLLICGSIITPVDKHSYNARPNAYTYVNDDGIIEAILELTPGIEPSAHEFLRSIGYSGEIEVLRLAKGEFLIPGFIDTHIHAPQFPNIGAGQENELLKWLTETVFPMEAKFKDVDFAIKAYSRVVKRVIDAGTTTCCYYGTLHRDASWELAKTVHKFGQRAFIGKCNMDLGSPDYYIEQTEESLPQTKELVEWIRGLPPSKDGTPYVYPILTPRFALATTDELLEELRDYADSEPSLAIQTHISENRKEVADVEDRFGCSYAEAYNRYHLLRENTVLGHGVHLSKEELDLIKEKDAGVAHCPTSNFNLTSGVAKVGDMLDRGIKVGLGTDVGGGFAPSILTTIRDASFAAKVVSFTSSAPKEDTNCFASKPLKIATLFWLATLGGAEVCNLQHKIGSLEVGKAFDAIVVDIRNTTGHHPTSPRNPNLWGVGDDLELGLDIRRRKDDDKVVDKETKAKEELDAMLERFMFCGDDRNLTRVYVQGRWIGGSERREGRAN